mgnify:CR=1 FL=1
MLPFKRMKGLNGKENCVIRNEWGQLNDDDGRTIKTIIKNEKVNQSRI